jgi:hypothetical protein
MFALTIKTGLAMSSAPDVCSVPSPGGPVPTPFVNLAQMALVDPNGVCRKVLIGNLPALTIKSKTLISSGDEAGVQGGVISGKFCGATDFLPTAGSSKVNFEGAKAVTLTAQTRHNGASNFNTMGTVTTPSQTTVMVAK